MVPKAIKMIALASFAVFAISCLDMSMALATEEKYPPNRYFHSGDEAFWEKYWLKEWEQSQDAIIVDGNEVKELEQGDSGSAWVYDLFLKDEQTGSKTTEKIAKYQPGHFPYGSGSDVFGVNVLGTDGKLKEGEIKLEVFVNHEF